MASVIEVHPQRADIEKAIIAGQTIRDIAKWVVPRVSAMAVQRHRTKLLKPALRNTAKSIVNEAIATAAKRGVEVSASELRDVAERQRLAQPFIARVAEMDAARARMFNLAESKEDPRGWASLDSVRLKAVELEAKLAGALDSQAAASQTSITMLLLPRPDAPEPAHNSSSAADAVVDIAPCE